MRTPVRPFESSPALRGLVVSLLFVVVVGLVALTTLPGCTVKHEDIAVYHESSPAAAEAAATLEAKDKGGAVHLVAATGSMEPTLHGGDYVVGLPTAFADLRVGMIVDYTPDWNERRLTVHRLVATWPDGGFLAEGDGPKNAAETQSRVSTVNYVDHVTSVYRFP